MTHEDIQILISAYFDNEVTPSEKNIVEEHLRTCAECQKEYKSYMSLSSSLSKWSNETLSPDEELKMQARFNKRREPMFTRQTTMALGTTLALTIVIGTVFQSITQHPLQSSIRGLATYFPIQGRLKSASDDMGTQYSDGNTSQVGSRLGGAQTMRMRSSSQQYQPYYMQSDYHVQRAAFKDADTDIDLPRVFNQHRVNAVYPTAQLYANAQTNSPMLPSAMMAYNNSVNQVRLATARVADKMDSMNVETFTDQNGVNPERKMIMNTDMTLKVADAQKAQIDLESLVAKYNGIIINYQMNKLDDGSRRGYIAFKVIPKNLRSLLAELRQLGDIQAENQSGVDITNQYDYLQSRVNSFYTQKERLQKLLSRNANDPAVSEDVQGQLSSVEANINSLQNNMKQLDDQSYMATVVVNFFDVYTTVTKTPTFKERLVSSFKDSFEGTLEVAYSIAINSLNGLVIVASFLIQIALWVLLFGGIYFLISRFFKK